MRTAGVDIASHMPTLPMAARVKSIFAGSIGNLIEWYDFYVYNAFVLYFAKQFAARPRRSRS